MRLLADECCPRALVNALRKAGHDVRSAAETDARSADLDLLNIANEEGRIIVTEDFDFGDLLSRDLLPARGAIILFLPVLSPADRAKRLLGLPAAADFTFEGKLTIIGERRVRQPLLPA
jgi:predicted nuclease of predicted toxin-antitoxin system